MDLGELVEALKKESSPVKAGKMRAYMRRRFEFLGVSTVHRLEICKPYAAESLASGAVDWDFISDCWLSPWREIQYFALECIYDLRDTLTPECMPKLKRLIEVKPWWDTNDAIDSIISYVALKYPELNKTLLEWSKDKSGWVRRVAICHQLDRRGKTNRDLLTRIIDNNLGSTEYYINTAIGRSLREYAKHNPDWVLWYINTRKDRLNSVSVKEGSADLQDKN
jgi:3-methyladenine DNA glycosylase AlkD